MLALFLSVVFQDANVFHEKILRADHDVKLQNFGTNWTCIFHMPQKGTSLGKLYSDIFGVGRMYHH